MMRRKWLFRLKVEHGQSVLEYSAISMMIMIGILVIGPYVVGSINAYFKGAEDQAHDSFREEIRQAQLQGDELNYDLGDCHCKYEDSFRCGDGTLCPRTQLMRRLECDPPGCLGSSSGPRAQCAMEELDQPIRTWQTCYDEKGMYPIGEEGYQEWRDDRCGYECCTDAEVAEWHCYFIEDIVSQPNLNWTIVKYKGSPYDGAHEWKLDVGDKVLNEADGKIYTVMGPKLPEGIVSHWKFDGDYLDSVGVHDGEINGYIPFVSGQQGKAVYFDGRFDDPPSNSYLDYNYIQVPSSTDFNFGTDRDFTFSAWIKPEDLSYPLCHWMLFERRDEYVHGPIDPNACATGFGGAGFIFFVKRYESPAVLGVQLNNGGDRSLPNTAYENYFSPSVDPIFNGLWHHIAVTVDRDGSLVFYVDGNSVLSKDLTYLNDGFDPVPLEAEPGLWNINSVEEQDLFIGASFWNPKHSHFHGAMDELMIYNGALSQEDIAEIYDIQSKGPGEWDGDDVEWDEGIQPTEGDAVYVLEDGSQWVYENGAWMKHEPGGGEDRGYLRMRRWCGDKGEVAQEFWQPSDDCKYYCGGKDEWASWCDPVSYNYGLTENLEAQHVEYGKCPEDNKCVAYCPDDSNWTHPGTLTVDSSDGCVCRGLWEWNLTEKQCDCLEPNESVDGECVETTICKYSPTSPRYFVGCSSKSNVCHELFWEDVSLPADPKDLFNDEKVLIGSYLYYRGNAIDGGYFEVCRDPYN